MIELKHIYKEYQGVNVLKDINISFPSKGLVTILGWQNNLSECLMWSC